MPRPVNEIRNAILCPGMRLAHCSQRGGMGHAAKRMPTTPPDSSHTVPPSVPCHPPIGKPRAMGKGSGGQGRLWVSHTPCTHDTGARHRAWHISQGEASCSAVANTKCFITLPLPLAFAGMNARSTHRPPPSMNGKGNGCPQRSREGCSPATERGGGSTPLDCEFELARPIFLGMPSASRASHAEGGAEARQVLPPHHPQCPSLVHQREQTRPLHQAMPGGNGSWG